MNAKFIRGQVRQIVKELLPELVKEAYYEDIKKEVDERIKRIENSVKETMHTINERSKDTQSYLVRAVSKPTSQPDKQ